MVPGKSGGIQLVLRGVHVSHAFRKDKVQEDKLTDQVLEHTYEAWPSTQYQTRPDQFLKMEHLRTMIAMISSVFLKTPQRPRRFNQVGYFHRRKDLIEMVAVAAISQSSSSSHLILSKRCFENVH